MKKFVIYLLLVAAVICSTSIGVFATHDTNPHVIEPNTVKMFTHDTNPY